MHIPRLLDLTPVLEQKSCFLFGPRQTGKTQLIKHRLQQYRTYNLLHSDVFARLSHSPRKLREETRPDDKIVIIDEIQKLPVLLDEVHAIIEETGVHFLLTGSSARKLKRTGANLLGGRARTRHLHPFVLAELDSRFDLLHALDVGLIPSIYLSGAPREDLEAYVGQYLKEEVAAEALVRNISAFSRFLAVAACCNGQIINYTNIGNDAQVPMSTVQEYFQILRDTLVGNDLPAWRQTTKRKPFATSKFYFFDIGVARFLQRRQNLQEGAPEYGQAFEAYVHHELRSYLDYRGKEGLCYWRSTSGFEVDFILMDTTAIEVKGKTNVNSRDLRGLRALREEG
ncbi:ATP-binding protein, partial [Verrucomicrobiota bacterium]